MKVRVIQKEVPLAVVVSKGATFRLFKTELEVEYKGGSACRVNLDDLAAEALGAPTNSNKAPKPYSIKPKKVKGWLNVVQLGKAITKLLGRGKVLSTWTTRDIVARYNREHPTTEVATQIIKTQGSSKGNLHYAAVMVPHLAADYKKFREGVHQAYVNRYNNGVGEKLHAGLAASRQ
jgi:hypothetical protein